MPVDYHTYTGRGRATVAQQRAINTLLPQYLLDPLTVFDPSSIFENTAAVEMEIGFGNGDTLLHLAASNPQKNYIGIDTWLPGFGRLLNGIETAGLNNIRLYQADARQILRDCIKDPLLEAIYILFPDPWPKQRHNKRRLLSDPFWSLAVRSLKDNAMIHIATDSVQYYSSICSELVDIQELRIVNKSTESTIGSELPPIQETAFEKKARKAGRRTCRLTLQRLP